MKVVKRDASLADFDKRKIETAILKSMKNGSGIVKPDIAAKIADEIEAECSESGEDEIDISDILSLYDSDSDKIDLYEIAGLTCDRLRQALSNESVSYTHLTLPTT